MRKAEDVDLGFGDEECWRQGVLILFEKLAATLEGAGYLNRLHTASVLHCVLMKMIDTLETNL